MFTCSFFFLRLPDHESLLRFAALLGDEILPWTTLVQLAVGLKKHTLMEPVRRLFFFVGLPLTNVRKNQTSLDVMRYLLRSRQLETQTPHITRWVR